MASYVRLCNLFPSCRGIVRCCRNTNENVDAVTPPLLPSSGSNSNSCSCYHEPETALIYSFHMSWVLEPFTRNCPVKLAIVNKSNHCSLGASTNKNIVAMPITSAAID